MLSRVTSPSNMSRITVSDRRLRWSAGSSVSGAAARATMMVWRPGGVVGVTSFSTTTVSWTTDGALGWGVAWAQADKTIPRINPIERKILLIDNTMLLLMI